MTTNESHTSPVKAMLESIWLDVRFGLRQMMRRRGFTIVALAVIALSVGANGAVLSFVDALYRKTPPVLNAAELVTLQGIDTRRGELRPALTADEYVHYRDLATSFSGVAAQSWTWMWLSNGERSVEWYCGRVSANYFDVLGVVPELGGFFSGANQRSAVVLSHRAWVRAFGASRDVIGRSLRLNGRPFIIVGVAARDFRGVYVGDSFDAWTVHDAPEGIVVGRLKADVVLEQARAETVTLAARSPFADLHKAIRLEPLAGVHPATRRALETLAQLLAAATACLLIVACANLAGLLMAGGNARSKEIAVRVSLGASRVRVLRQLLTESVVLSVCGGLLGIVVALHVSSALERFFGYQIPDLTLELHPRVLLMLLVLSVAVGVAFGVVPAWRATRGDLTAAARSSSPSGLSAIALQIALSTVLLIGAGLLLQSVRAVLVRPGLDPERIAHFRLRPSRLGYSLDRARTYQRELLRRIEAVPGVDRAVIARVPPDRGWCCESEVSVPGQPPVTVEQNEIGPGFLSTLNIPVWTGREFVDGDRDVAVVNRALAAKLWPGQSALDREILVDGRAYRVVGVAADIHATRAGETSHPYLYLPLWARDVRDVRLFVRVDGPASRVLEALRQELMAVDPDVHVGQESTLAERTAISYQRERLLAALVEFTAVAAAVLSAIGLYGLVSYQVARRTRELAIRVALGAQRRSVVQLIMRRGLAAAMLGIAVGALASTYATRLLTSSLYGVEPLDPITFVTVASLLAAVALAASLIPARAAAHVDVIDALRTE